MQSATATTEKLTYRDFLKFPDDGKRHELIDGVHYATPAPYVSHQAIIGNLHFLIRLHLEAHAAGRVYTSPLDVKFSIFDVFEPDLLFISAERMAILTEKFVQGAPDLVVEVHSKSTKRRDVGLKLRHYDRFGVREYWMIDPDAKTVVVHRRQGDEFPRLLELALQRGDVLTTPLLPNLSIDLKRVFAD